MAARERRKAKRKNRNQSEPVAAQGVAATAVIDVPAAKPETIRQYILRVSSNKFKFSDELEDEDHRRMLWNKPLDSPEGQKVKQMFDEGFAQNKIGLLRSIWRNRKGLQ